MWDKIIYHCLIQGKYMTDVMSYGIYRIYALLHDDIDINIGDAIFFIMWKVRYHHEHRYRLCGLLTRFLRNQRVEEGALDYRLMMDTHILYISRTKGLIMAHRLVLTMP